MAARASSGSMAERQREPEPRRPPPDEVDETSIESFPASDPPSWTPVVRPGPPEREDEDEETRDEDPARVGG